MNKDKLLVNKATTGDSEVRTTEGSLFAKGQVSAQATVSGTGLVSATIDFKISNDGIGWITAATFTLSGTNLDSSIVKIDDFDADNKLFESYKATVSSISGTGAVVNFTLVS